MTKSWQQVSDLSQKFPTMNVVLPAFSSSSKSFYRRMGIPPPPVRFNYFSERQADCNAKLTRPGRTTSIGTRTSPICGKKGLETFTS